MAETRSDILQGTLDLMVLQTLDAMGPLHGYGIARRIEQISEDVLQLNQGTIYASLLRLQQRRWISASWGTSDNNRKAKFYAITRGGPEAARRAGRRTGSGSPASSMRMLRLAERGDAMLSTWLAVARCRGSAALLLDRGALDDEFDREIVGAPGDADRGPHPPRPAARRRRGAQAVAAIWRTDADQGTATRPPQPAVRRDDAAGHPLRAPRAARRTRRIRWSRSPRWPSASAPAPRSSASPARCCCGRCPTRIPGAWSGSSKPTRSRHWTRNIASPANYADWKAQNTVFTDIAAYEQFNINGSGASDMFLTGFGEPQGLKSLGVTGNLFDVLGAAPLLGRTFTDEETFDGKARVAVLSYGLWQIGVRRRSGTSSARRSR